MSFFDNASVHSNCKEKKRYAQIKTNNFKFSFIFKKNTRFKSKLTIAITEYADHNNLLSSHFSWISKHCVEYIVDMRKQKQWQWFDNHEF
ncbi:hypothetical protein V9T40_012831 [Parthenolecanium corni]|uniref:Uncharacterized protein n=1 Tax=Parthenolecanium corni TaxID=536013 RepID=A0AAN9T8G6_9HEMI